MTHLDDPSQLDAVFLNLGKIHAKHEEQLGFSAHYWSVFKECVLFHFRKAMKANNKFSKKSDMSFAEIDSAIILWREVLRFIIDREIINGQHSISADDSGLSSGLSVETKQDLTQHPRLALRSRPASRRRRAICSKRSQLFPRNVVLLSISDGKVINPDGWDPNITYLVYNSSRPSTPAVQVPSPMMIDLPASPNEELTIERMKNYVYTVDGIVACATAITDNVLASCYHCVKHFVTIGPNADEIQSHRDAVIDLTHAMKGQKIQVKIRAYSIEKDIILLQSDENLMVNDELQFRHAYFGQPYYLLGTPISDDGNPLQVLSGRISAKLEGNLFIKMMESLSHLTPTDREILNKSWAIVSKDMQQVAVNIFQMIFEQAPDAKLMFSFMMKDYKEDKKSNEFIFHAVRFIQVIESTMTHLDDPSQLDAVFLNLGKIHAKHEEQLGFSAHYWSVFKECVLFHFRKAMKANNKLFSKKSDMSFAEIDSAIILWREVLRFIIDREIINGQHSISADDSGLSSGLSVETKQDLTQVQSTLDWHSDLDQRVDDDVQSAQNDRSYFPEMCPTAIFLVTALACLKIRYS
ncbi:unnamed protein product [Caenorhabditis sp. 36 PRJEB53466]|nr:unnamed protein product [Caenorhabditis sp. 36 PRJEB53466]